MSLYLGFTFFSLFIGFLLGASNTPVIGLFLTSIFGFIGTLLGTQYVLNINNANKYGARFLGISMLAVSISLFIGTISGGFYRTESYIQVEQTLPWEGAAKPRSTKEALDWILVKEKMNLLGYSDEDVAKVYQIRSEEIELLEEIIKQESTQEEDLYSSELPTVIYDESAPFYLVFPKEITPKKRANRAPSSINGD
ncbi:hypothetical protein [Shewanella nanhaiensis]|uniref:Uncharacterized protein n=1 Tax=Shewanella nanhaiensis TaxID=2864872 RepID=A0ABS7DYM5_9GAMM|nr:hypothetical protein [Shewanella nanhaiensis]MBW8182525.1 hypothetical protein [Shewanella nanhaiensis]